MRKAATKDKVITGHLSRLLEQYLNDNKGINPQELTDLYNRKASFVRAHTRPEDFLIAAGVMKAAHLTPLFPADDGERLITIIAEMLDVATAVYVLAELRAKRDIDQQFEAAEKKGPVNHG